MAPSASSPRPAAIETGDWTDLGFAVVGGGLEALSVVTDPLGSVFSAAPSSLIEHFQPLTGALNWLAGDADAVLAHAQTWRNVADSPQQTPTGPAAAQLIRAQSEAASGLSSATETAGTPEKFRDSLTKEFNSGNNVIVVTSNVDADALNS
ncbi:hypothetical protein [Saccharopolyspora sp. 5N708]|uniref:hypothetical protein n=1 Tax=Saccharopolyspora sp. 5N708 TaxID=3457424 RepID=UPI003FD1BC19